jgi:hypothetical protein
MVPECKQALRILIRCTQYRGERVLPNSWQEAFRTSKLFTRGWTLQELLAPKSVEFYFKQHHRLGDKKSLEQQIHDIKGISIQALQESPLSHFTINERMSWVENAKPSMKIWRTLSKAFSTSIYRSSTAKGIRGH